MFLLARRKLLTIETIEHQVVVLTLLSLSVGLHLIHDLFGSKIDSIEIPNGLTSLTSGTPDFNEMF